MTRTWREAVDGILDSNVDANNVVENNNKQFISEEQKSKIINNDIAINNIQTELNNSQLTDEKVKLTSADTSSYLGDKLDNNTLKINSSNKVEAVSLKGLAVSVKEVNYLDGVDSNIQSQINNLSKMINFYGVVEHESDLPTDHIPNGSVVIVTDDISHGNVTTYYISNGNTLSYAGRFNTGDGARNFSTNPLNLDSETTGTLPKNKYVPQDASEMSFSHSGFNATNVEDAIAELKDTPLPLATTSVTGGVRIPNGNGLYVQNGVLYAAPKSAYLSTNNGHYNMTLSAGIVFNNVTKFGDSISTNANNNYVLTNNTPVKKLFSLRYSGMIQQGVGRSNIAIRNVSRNNTILGQQAYTRHDTDPAALRFDSPCSAEAIVEVNPNENVEIKFMITEAGGSPIIINGTGVISIVEL